ncbi:hypothetical protein C9374_013727 [Naegleria lovaniensis]|uniref:Adenylate and Guanylate cyclase catalytic domain containing protein n=1 Tax=Naegleria lovaniensis TaxID=51637 RepID=A0AA88GEL8_NAELO|nr:uncharacterized protein C9374_013727 [Naegleria lovaniensis]KAG2370927.1 hypothetical protein C9374_013727 [Naegleria lovaniensis]
MTTHSIASNGSCSVEVDDTPQIHSSQSQNFANGIAAAGRAASVLSADQQTSLTATGAASLLDEGATLWNSIEESATNFLLSIQVKTKIHATNWYGFVYNLFVNLYWIWTMLFLPALAEREYQWGEYSTWVFRALNYPVTLSLSLVSYEAIIAIFFVYIAILTAYIVILAVGYRASLLANKYWKRLKLALRVIHGFVTITSFIFCYVIGAFFDCNYASSILLPGSERPVQVLARHPTVACYGALNSVLIALSAIFLIVLLVILFISAVSMTEDNPSSKNVFSTDFVFYYYPFLITQCLYIILVSAIPSTYPVVKPVIYLALSLLFLVYHLYVLPFFRKIENSIFFGFLTARVGGSIGFLVSALVATNNKDWEFGLGMMGLTLGLIVIAFVIGIVASEIYIGILYNSIRSSIINVLKSSFELSQLAATKTPIEREASNIYQKFEKEGKLRNFNLFLKFSMKSGKQSISNEAPVSDVDISLSLIKGVSSQKSANNVDILVTSAIVVAYYLPNFTSVILAGGILRKVVKLKKNMMKKFVVTQRTKEIEFLSGEDLSGKNIMEIKNIISILEKKQELILLLHKAFWKEMVNESLDIVKIENINRKISNLVSSCQSTYDILLSNYSNEKTVIRSYARFIEDYKFDPEKAQEMYQEANIIEEEEAINRRHQLQKTLTKSKYPTTTHINRVVPVPINPSTTSMYGGQPEDDDNRGYFEKVDTQKQGFSVSRMDDLDYENEKFEGVEENAATAQQKKEFLFRTALRSSMYNKPQCVTFVIFAVGSLVCLAVGLILGLVFSTGVTEDIHMSNDVCLPSSSPLGLLRYVRYKQIHDEIVGKVPLWDISNRQNLKEECTKLQNLYTLSMSTSSFSENVRADYTRSSRFVTEPILLYSNATEATYTGYSTTRNSTIAEITKSLIKSCNSFLRYSDAEFKNSVTDYNFMFLYMNRINFSASYEKFCSEYLSRNKEKSSTFRTIFLGYYVASTALYIFCAFSVIAFTRYNLTTITDSVRLMGKHLSKDKVGKIYHKLESKVDEDVQIGAEGIVAMIFKPSNAISILVITMISITAICVTLFFVETVINSDSSSLAIQNIQFSVNAMMTAQRIGLRLGEIFVFKSPNFTENFYLSDKRLTSDRELSKFHTDHKDLAGLIQVSWYSLLFGTAENNYFKLLGKYPEIDDLIMGTCGNSGNSSNSTDCTGVDDLITSVTSSSAKFNEDVYYNSDKFTSLIIYDWLTKLYDDIDLISHKIERMVDLYSGFTSSPSIAITIVFALVGFITLILAIYFTAKSMGSFWEEYRHLRMMLNYFSHEVLEENEELKNFVLFKTLPGRVTDILKVRKRRSADLMVNEDSHVRSILNAAVDGAVLCNSQAEVTIFNPSAERSFGYKKSDVFGLSIYTLFDESSHVKLKKVIDSVLISSQTNNNNAAGESLELDCIRKNQTKFPAKINVFASNMGNETVVVCFIKDITPEKKQNMLLEEEKKKSDSLLLNILPEAVGNRLKSGETFIAEKFNDVSCFFSDMVGFTSMSSVLNATDLVKMLNTIVNGFDALTDKYHLEKIKTIGDAYFCVGGIHNNSTSDHPERVLRFAIDVFTVVHDYNHNHVFAQDTTNNPNYLNIRIGINTGPVVGGVIGTKKFAYDMWGDTINVASRMESTSKPGRVQCSRSTYERVYDLGFEFEERRIEVKGKGITQTYLLFDRHHKNPLPINANQLVSESDTIIRKVSSSATNEDMMIGEADSM